VQFEPCTQEILLGHHWPGNVRELEHAIEHAVTFARGGPIQLRHLPPHLQPSPVRPVVNLDLESRDSVCFDAVVAECERALLDWALARTGGNQVRAAKLLELSRTTLRGRLAAARERTVDDESATEGEAERH
jgi:DNA-binding NtrC family response regulator